MVPVAPLGETVAVNVIDVPEVADVADAVSVVVELPLELAVVPPDPQPESPNTPKERTVNDSNKRK